MLEEEPFKSQVGKETIGGGLAQFVLRVGPVVELPQPKSPRRPLSSFVRFG